MTQQEKTIIEGLEFRISGNAYVDIEAYTDSGNLCKKV